jgi:hypothetical protein
VTVLFDFFSFDAGRGGRGFAFGIRSDRRAEDAFDVARGAEGFAGPVSRSADAPGGGPGRWK